jgi:uncharacterized coiled-coil protein SlyX
LSEKYNEIESKFKLLEEEKLNISNRLNEANDQICEFNKPNKEKIYSDEKDQVRSKYDDIIQKQRDKIEKLEKMLENSQNSQKDNISVTVNKQNIQINNSVEFFNQLFRLSEKNEDLKNYLQLVSKNNNNNQNAVHIGPEKKPVDMEDLPEDGLDGLPQNPQDFQLEKQKFQNEKKYIMKTLEEKAEKIAQLEIENKELYERSKMIESKLNPVKNKIKKDDKNYVKKIVSLEKNLEQINLMYHQLVTQKSEQKISIIVNYFLIKVMEKKLKKKNDALSQQEKDIQQLNDQIKLLNEKVLAMQRGTIKNFAPNNVVKVMKGGQCK